MGAAPSPGWYTSPEHFERERRAVLHRSWVSVGRVAELAEPGDWKSFDHAGEPILVVRGKDGVIRAFPNVCRHRGTRLLEGCGRARSLQCPYHLWTYDLAGRLVGAPDMDAVPGFDRADHGLPELRVECWGGWVFVHLDPDAPPLLASNPTLGRTYEGRFLESLVCAGRTRADQDVNWKVVVENFIESYHHAGTHPDTLQEIFPYQQIEEIAPEKEAWSTIEHAPAVPGIEPFTASCIFPTHLFAIVRPRSVTWFKLGIRSHDRTEVEVEVLLPPEAAEAEAGNGGTDMAFLDAINCQDELVNRRTFEGLKSRHAVLGPLSPYEKGLARFRGWLTDALTLAEESST